MVLSHLPIQLCWGGKERVHLGAPQDPSIAQPTHSELLAEAKATACPGMGRWVVTPWPHRGEGWGRLFSLEEL